MKFFFLKLKKALKGNIPRVSTQFNMTVFSSNLI